MDSSDLYTTRDGDLELKADEKPIDFSIPTSEVGLEEKSELETKELQSETIPIDLTMDGGTETGNIEEIETPETEQLITGRSVGEEIDNSPIELGEDIIISKGENKIDFQQYALKNLKDGEDDQDAVTLKQLNEYTPEIGDNSITTDKLANGAVTSAKIASKGIETGNIADGAISNDKLAANAVTTDEIADEAVTSIKLANYVVTEEKIASNAVGTSNLINNNVTSEKIKWDTMNYLTVFADGQSLTQGSYKIIVFNPNKSIPASGKSVINGNFTYDTTNNCITIGEGVSAIEVSANAAIQDGTDGQEFWGVISLNDTNAANRICSNNGYMKTGQYSMVAMAPVILNVVSGDKIRLLVYTNSATAKIRGDNAFTYLTIKQVG